MQRLSVLILFMLGFLAPMAVSAQEAIFVAHGGGSVFSQGSSFRLFKSFKIAFDLGGGRSAKIVTLDGSGNDENDELASILRRAGYRNANHLRISDPSAPEKVAGADVIYFDGGVQTKMMRKLQAFPRTLAALRQARYTAKVIGGVSAGAAVLSDIMICCDRGGSAIESRGIGYLGGFVVDQHYSQRDREFRLRQVISANPGLIGVGIDETVAVIFQNGTMKVVRSPENNRRPNQKFSGCKTINGEYQCTCDANLTPEKPCIANPTVGKDANQFATMVQMVNGKLVETQLTDGQVVKF